MRTRKKYLGEIWTKLEAIFSPGISQLQRDEMRKMFYTGADAMYQTIMRDLTEGPEVNKRDLQKMEDLYFELNDFVKELLTGVKR